MSFRESWCSDIPEQWDRDFGNGVALGRMRFSPEALQDVFRLLPPIREVVWQRPEFCGETPILTISRRFSHPQELNCRAVLVCEQKNPTKKPNC